MLFERCFVCCLSISLPYSFYFKTILVNFAAIARPVVHLSKSAEVMKLANNLRKAPEVATTMQEFNKEMTKVFGTNFYLWSKRIDFSLGG